MYIVKQPAPEQGDEDTKGGYLLVELSVKILNHSGEGIWKLTKLDKKLIHG